MKVFTQSYKAFFVGIKLFTIQPVIHSFRHSLMLSWVKFNCMRCIYWLVILILPAFSFAQLRTKPMDQYLNRQQSLLLETYRYLHQNPELSRMEQGTAMFLKERMKAYGYKIVDSLGYHSFAAVMENGAGPKILYRTDMDGLPIKEETGLPYASNKTYEREGEKYSAMHACGHDLHMATWLGLAGFFSEHREKWKGTLIFLAQSAEESGQGAKKIVKSDNFKTIPTPDIQLAIHTQPDLTSGIVGLCQNYAMAAVDMMSVTIVGKGGHGAAPEKTIDPIVMSARFINDIQTIVSRNLSSREPAVITVGAVHGGTVGNIIPDKVELKLTIRSFSAASREKILKRIKEIGDGIAMASGMDTAHLPIYDLGDMSIPPVFNNPGLGERIKKIIQESRGLETIRSYDPVMIGEDFGVYGNYFSKAPAYLIWMGVADKPDAGKLGLHSSKFYPDINTALPSALGIMGDVIMGLFSKE